MSQPPRHRRWAVAVILGVGFALCCVVLLVASPAPTPALKAAWNGIIGETSAPQCDDTSGSDVVQGMHSSFKELSKTLLQLKGEMDEALHEDDCARVIALVGKLQEYESRFASLRDEYKGLSAADQQAVALCFDNTLMPQSNGVQAYATHALSQCGTSNPLVAQASALIDAAAADIQNLQNGVDQDDCEDLVITMGTFVAETKQFEQKLNVILGKLGDAQLLVEQRLVSLLADHKLLKASDAFYETWDAKWDTDCTLAQQEAGGAEAEKAQDSGGADDSSAAATSSNAAEGGESGEAAAVVGSGEEVPSGAQNAVDETGNHHVAAATNSTGETTASASVEQATTAAAAAVVAAVGTTEHAGATTTVAAAAATPASK